MAYGKKKEDSPMMSLVDATKELLSAPRVRQARKLNRKELLSVHRQRINSARPRVKLDPDAMVRALKMNVRDLNNRGEEISLSEYRSRLGL